MNYREFRPSPSLWKYIECFWTVQSGSTNGSHKEKILPDGCIEIIFHLRDPVKRHGEDQVSLQPLSFVSGQIRKFILIEPTRDYEALGVRFRPGMSYPFIKIPCVDYTGESLGLDTIWGSNGTDLTEMVRLSRSATNRIRLIEAFLSRQLSPKHETDAIVKAAITAVLQSEGRISIDQLQRRVNLGSRQLERAFGKAVGLSPKLFSRIVRFQSVFKLLANMKGPAPLTRLALDSGYFDQAHFIKEFKEFTGQSPSKYFGHAHPMSDFFTSKARLSNFYNSVPS